MVTRIEALIRVLRTGDWETAQQASGMLAELGPAAIEPLLALMREYPSYKDYAARTNPHSQAEEVLLQIGEPAVLPLIGALEAEEWGAYAGAAYVLGELGDVRAIQPLIEAMRFERNRTSEMIDALEKLGEPALRPLLYALKNHDNPNVRQGAASMLGNFNDPSVVPALIAALESDPDRDVRQISAWGLGELKDARAIEPLIAALRDAEPSVRETSVRSLGEIGQNMNSVRITDSLARALHDSDWGTRQSAAEMLLALDAYQSDAAEALLLADLENADAEIRLGAAWSLVALGDDRALEPLVRLLYHHDARIAAAAARGLGELGDARAIPVLTAALSLADDDVREAVQDALRRFEQNGER